MIVDLALGAFALVGFVAVAVILARAARRHVRQAEMHGMRREVDRTMDQWSREARPR